MSTNRSAASRSGQTIAFVPPRFGDDVVGGAEAVIAEAARGFAQRGYRVEILTTCARDHFTWANEYAAGVSERDGLTIRRFPDSNRQRRCSSGTNRCSNLSGRPVDIADQQLWANDSLRVSELWHHVLDHAADYRALIFAPYMFWTTYAVGQVAPARSIIMPCLHDEPPAKLDIFKPLISGSRGVWFLTEPEAQLADELFDLPKRNAIVGAGIDIPERYNPAAFRAEYKIEKPFIYYAGRREWGKGWNDLLAAYAELVRRHGSDLLLVTSGVGEVDAPPDVAARVIDVGFLTDEQRNNAMAAAVAYVQPSVMESFSRTVLEAWAAGTTVIANAGSAVVAWHTERSGAGLLYRSEAELTESLHFAADEPEAMNVLAAGGRAYVEEHYLWDAVLDRMEETLDQWLPVGAML